MPTSHYIPERTRQTVNYFCPVLKGAFFTTKNVTGGTGLGLTISREIVRSHHGEIRVASQRGQETRFTVSLPLARALAAQPAGGADAHPLPALGERTEHYGEHRAPKASAPGGPGR